MARETDLIARVAEGDRRAFEEVYNLYQRRMARFRAGAPIGGSRARMPTASPSSTSTRASAVPWSALRVPGPS